MNRYHCKKICASIFLTLSPPTFAAIPTQFWYASANVGLSQGLFNLEYKDQTDVIAQNIRESILQQGYTGGLGIGYSKQVYTRYIIGAEVSASYLSNNAYFSSGASSTAFDDKLTIDKSFDLVFSPGILIGDSMVVYGKLGLSYAYIYSSLNTPTGFTPTYVKTNNTETSVGLALGLGVKKMVTDHIALFSEYNYHDYGQVGFPSFQNFTATYSHSAHVYTQYITVGMSYLF